VGEAGITIDDVNRLDRDAFVMLFGGVYEVTPGLAETVWAGRPFRDHAALLDAFHAASRQLSDADALQLLRAHPELATVAPMANESRREQRAAGLTELDDATHERLVAGNARYRERFGFPFIIAVRGLQPTDIVAALEVRLGHSASTELATARNEVDRIAEARLSRLVAP
jgi:2-oxo-4-hydroxy-4-carboxy-5-ureidoimidazoline decarboxylase